MTDPKSQSPIFVKTYDFLLWLIPLTLKFPKSQRFLLAERLGKMALDFYDLILEAVLDPDHQSERLAAADKLLTKVSKSRFALAGLVNPRNLEDLRLRPPGAFRDLLKVRLYMRLSYDLHCISQGQFEHAARHLDEIGRLMGGWQKKNRNQDLPRRRPAAI